MLLAELLGISFWKPFSDPVGALVSIGIDSLFSAGFPLEDCKFQTAYNIS